MQFLTRMNVFGWVLMFVCMSGADAQQQVLSEKRVDSISTEGFQVVVTYDPTLARPHELTSDERKDIEDLNKQGVLLDFVIETKISRSGAYFQVWCNSGGSADYECRFQDQEGSQKASTLISGLRFEIPGDGCVYSSGHNDTLFNLRRKFCLKDDKLEEIKQPFQYVGLKSTVKRNLPFFTDLTMHRSVGIIKNGGFVEVLVAMGDGSSIEYKYFLVRDERGLTGWISVGPDNEGKDIEGLYFAGD